MPSDQHQMAFANVVPTRAIGVEAAGIVDHDRRLPDLAHVVERGRERLVAGLLAEDDLDQHHPLDRREEMDADEIRRSLSLLGEDVIGSVEVLEPKIASSASTACAFAVTSAFTARSSNTASMTRSQPSSAA